MDNVVEQLRDGCVLHPRRWSGDAHADLGGTVDEDTTDAVMDAAANEIEVLQAERDAAEDTCEKLMALITALADAHDATSQDRLGEFHNAHELNAALKEQRATTKALRKAVGR